LTLPVKCAKINENNANVEVKLAENYEGLPPEIEKLSERLAKDPKSLVFSPLANAYRKNSMVDEAIEILQKGLEIHPNYASARIVLGKCYADKRMYELAKEEFKNALENDPQNIVVLESIGEVYKILNQHEKAYETYKKLLDLDPLNERIEKEVESLKTLSGEISPQSDEYASFQTIPGKSAKKEVPQEEEPEANSNAPSLSEVFETSPESTETKETTMVVEEIKESDTISTAADFTAMFETEQAATPSLEETTTVEPQPPVTETPAQKEENPIDSQAITEEQLAPVEPQEESKPLDEPIPPQTEPPVTEESPQTFEQPQQPETTEPSPEVIEMPQQFESPQPREELAKATEKPEEENQQDNIRMEGVTSIFGEGDMQTSPDMPSEATTAETKDIVTELNKELEEKKIIEPPSIEKPLETEKTIQQSETGEPQKSEEAPAATETLAEIYLSQGFTDEAVKIYKELLSKDPTNEKIKQKLEALEKQTGSETQQPQPQQKHEEPDGQKQKNQSKNLDNFQDWLKKFQK